MKPILSFHNAHARLPNWECHAGERWLLVAPSGWGKTIWLKQASLLRDADSSEVFWHGDRVLPAIAARFRSRWIYVPQTPLRSPHTIAQHLTALCHLGVHAHRDLSSLVDKIVPIFARLGLPPLDVHQKTLAQLSGGELQALALARSVALEPEGLFLDEPMSAMDRRLRLRTEEWFLESYEGAFVWVSHDEEQVARLATHGARQMPITAQPEPTAP